MKKYQVKKFLKDPFILSSIIAGVIIWAITFGIAYVQLLPLNANLILHTNFIRQVDSIGTTSDIAWLVTGLIILFVLNQALSLFVYFRERALSYVLSYTGLTIQIFGFMAIYYLTLLN